MKKVSRFLYHNFNQRSTIIFFSITILIYGASKFYILSNYRGKVPQIKNVDSVFAKISGGFERKYVLLESKLDLNKMTKDELLTIGISNQIAERLINFREKINGFDSYEEMRKIYGISTFEVNMIEKNTFLNRKGKEFYDIKKEHNFNINLHKFDPNFVTENELEQMGIPNYIIKSLVKSRLAGFTFREKEDLKKLYVMSEDWYSKLEPFILINHAKFHPEKVFTKVENVAFKTSQKIEINTASEEEFDHLPGIGAFYAKNIIKFRTALGGFYSIEQVGETRSLPDSVYIKIIPLLDLKKERIKKIDINLATEAELNYHPYIDAKQASIIIAYRKNYGNFKSINDLLKIPAFDKIWFEKISNYLKVE